MLIWLPTSRREATARRVLHRAWSELDAPQNMPIATAAAELINPQSAHPSPADEVWLPLDAPGGQPSRRRLHQLLDAWPHVAPPVVDDEGTSRQDTPVLMAPPPAPMPPTTSHDLSTAGRR